MARIGRNSPCPCGSGKKYKRCCGSFSPNSASHLSPPEEVDRIIRELEARNIQRQQQQGLGRPIISSEVMGQRVVAVGNTLHASPRWKTFHDFLRDYLIERLGQEWAETERLKPDSERHIIINWFVQAVEDIQRLGTKRGDLLSGPMTGASRAFLNLAYNIYLIGHHTSSKEKGIVDLYIRRLKKARAGDFVGALYETYAAAAFLRAGFEIEFEDERDGSNSHVEFVATHRDTRKKFSVEVKSRESSNLIGETDNIKRLRVANKLNKALGKKAEHARVVMIEVNIPDLIGSAEISGWPAAALKQIRDNERTVFPDGDKRESAYVFVTNHTFHNNLDSLDVGVQGLAAGFRIRDFGADVSFNGYRTVLESRERHREMFDLMKSMKSHYEIPTTFDGEIPELEFSTDKGLPRLEFGKWYVIPTKEGKEVAGRLYEAVVIEAEKKVTGIYQLRTGESVMVQNPLSDSELAAYRHHPDTFFGHYTEANRKCETVTDLCDFMFETYGNTDRDRLLEFMKGASDFEKLKNLSQRDLAITYVERCAVSMFNESSKKAS